MRKLPQLIKAKQEAHAAAKAALELAKNPDLSAEDAAKHLATCDEKMAEVAKLDEEIKAVEAEQKAIEERAAKLGAMAAVPASRVLEARSSGTRERRQDDPTRGFASIGDFAMDVFRAGTGAGTSELLAAGQGLNQAVPSEGGFLVPPQFSTAIWDGLNTGTNSLLSMTDQYQIDGESLTFPANAETSRANGSRYGGIQAYWLAEAAQITKSTPKFRNMKLEPHGLAALVYVTDKLLKNASALNQYIGRAAMDEINFVVGDAIINGTGAGQPLGIMNSASLVTVAKETSQAAATVLQANISKMWARLHPRSRANAVWLYNVDVEPQFDGLNLPIKNVAGTENVGGIGNNVWNAERQTLKGRPVIPVEYCQTLGTVGDLILVDLGMYATGLGGGMRADISMHLRFDYAEQAFRFMFSVDGQPWLGNALTPFKGSNTLTTHVALATRS